MSLKTLGQIDLNKKLVKPNIFLCKPNKSIIAKISESYDITFNVKLGALNELNFKLPFYIEKRHELIRNNNADLIRGRYIIKLILGDYEEYFILNKNNKASSDEYVEVNSLSLGYELNDKLIRNYSEVSKTATELLNAVMIDTIWKVGFIDSEFDLKYRGLDVSSSTVLELVTQIAQNFNALIVWDTINRKVNFYKPDNYGIDRGFRVKYGKYLEDLNQEDNAEEIITRLKLYGQEDLTIRSVNPTGTTYIEDYTFFIYPYSEVINNDSSYEIISHSNYMSDELCHALIKYDKLLQDNKDDFSIILAKKQTNDSVLTQKNNDLIKLDSDFRILLDERDILNTEIAQTTDDLEHAQLNYEDSSILAGDLNSYKSQLTAKLQEIVNKQNEIDAKENEIIVAEQMAQETDNELLDLNMLFAVENNFTQELLDERNQYIIEKEWSNTNIDNPNDLLLEGINAFNDLKQQKITLKINVVNFLSMITEQRNWDKLNIGDIFTIDYERMNISFSAKITEIDYNFEDESIDIQISNVKDLYADKDKFLQMLYQSYSTSTQVSIDDWKWDLSLENHGAINDLINNIWDANKQAIKGAKDQVIEISDRGLIIRDPKDPMNYLVGLNSMIAITNDGGATWKHAITSTGIVGERIYGKVIMGVNLAIEDEHGIVKWQGSKGEIYDRNKTLVMKLGLVEENGLCGESFGLISFNDITQVKVTDCEGFVISRKNNDITTYPDGWEKLFWANQSDGTLYAHDIIASNLKIVSNQDWANEIFNAETGFFNIGFFKQIVKDNKLTTDEKLQVITELNKIFSNYQNMLSQASKYQISSRDNVINMNGAFNGSFPTTYSSTNRYSTQPLTNAYLDLINYMTSYVRVTSPSPYNPLVIDVNDAMTEQTSDIPDRATFILKFKTYYDEAEKLLNNIEDAISYSGISMGEYYNNTMISEYGLVTVRSDGKYRAYLNATNGLALQKWENSQWVNKLYASLGNPLYDDGTLIVEDLVAKRLRIVDGNLGTKILLDEATGITVFGNNNLQVRMNATEGFAIDANGDKRIWIGTDGTIRARKLIVLPDGEEEPILNDDGSYISELTVRSLRGLAYGGTTQFKDDYMYISKNYLKIMGLTKSKFELKTVESPDGYSMPQMAFGIGDSDGYDKGYITKTQNSFELEYIDGSNFTKGIYMKEGALDDSITIVTPHGILQQGNKIKLMVNGSNYIEISTSGVKIVGSRIDLN